LEIKGKSGKQNSLKERKKNLWRDESSGGPYQSTKEVPSLSSHYRGKTPEKKKRKVARAVNVTRKTDSKDQTGLGRRKRFPEEIRA